jgi:hypothetical protein
MTFLPLAANHRPSIHRQIEWQIEFKSHCGPSILLRHDGKEDIGNKQQKQRLHAR